MNPLFVTRGKTPKGVSKFQPRATPWEPEGKLSANSERVRELNPRLLEKRFIRELLQSSGIVTGSLTQGVALGWNLLTPPAFWIRQVCLWPREQP